MPVLLTRPASAVARATAELLLDDGAQVRLFGPDAPPEFRARGAFIASGDRDDIGLLEAALEQVHTLVHVGPGLLASEPAALLAEGTETIDAAVRARVQRIVLLSLPGAHPDAREPLRAAAGRLEAHAAAAPVPTVVVRPGVVDTAALRDAAASLSPAPDDAIVAPVGVDDLAAGLLAIDEARSAATEGHVVFAAPGPEPLTLDEWLRRTGVRGTTGVTNFVGRTYRPQRTGLATALAGPWVELPDAPGAPAADLWSFADRRPTPVG